MNTEATCQGRSGKATGVAGTVATRYPSTTGLQCWTAAFTSLIVTAREQLSDREYDELVALLTTSIARENSRLLRVQLQRVA